LSVVAMCVGLAFSHLKRDRSGMAKRTITELIDDLDGSPAEVSREIALDGVVCALDVSAANSAKLDEALAPFIAAGSKLGRGGPRLRLVRSARSARATSPADRERNAAVRAWAAEQGLDVSDRGRIKSEILAAYKAAQNAPVPVKRTRKAVTAPEFSETA
jgi:Lsr2